MTGKEYVIALSVTFMFFVGVIFITSTKLVARNWRLYWQWCVVKRSTRVKLCLWLGVPLVMGGLLWMRGTAMYNYLVVSGCCPRATVVQMLTYMPMILSGLAMFLYWICDCIFNWRGDEDGPGAVAADSAWLLFMVGGIALGVATYVVFLMGGF